MKTSLLFVVTSFFGMTAFAQSGSSDLMCRAKAKELASSTYSSCVTEARNQQVEQIRANYQKELAAVKAKYDRELKKMSGKKQTAKDSLSVKEVKEVKLAKPVKGIAKTLPAKANTQSEAAPIIEATEGEKVVAMTPERVAEPLEQEQVGADQIENIDTPAE
ncbi:MAG: hypothetical protein ACKOX6_09440 [Bdellovibrio sp.]